MRNCLNNEARHDSSAMCDDDRRTKHGEGARERGERREREREPINTPFGFVRLGEKALSARLLRRSTTSLLLLLLSLLRGVSHLNVVLEAEFIRVLFQLLQIAGQLGNHILNLTGHTKQNEHSRHKTTSINQRQERKKENE